MNEARERILGRLRANRPQSVAEPETYRKALHWDREQRIASFVERMQAVRGEVHRVPRDSWLNWINNEIPGRGMAKALIGSGEVGDRFAAGAAEAFRVTRYDRRIEDWKDSLFRDIDFAITGTLAGLAESGSLVLWPGPAEPRLMSLVPPLHLSLIHI